MSSLASRMCAISFDAPMFTLIFASSSTMSTSKRPPFRPRFLPERQVEAAETGEVLRRLLVVERAEDAIGELPDRQLRRRAFMSMKSGAMACAHRRLGGDEQAREVDRAPREVLGLHAVAHRPSRRELGAGVVLELGEHHDHDGDRAEHHDERDAALALPAARASRRLVGGALIARDPERERLLDGQEHLRRVAYGGPLADALEHERDRDLERKAVRLTGHLRRVPRLDPLPGQRIEVAQRRTSRCPRRRR